MPFINTENIIVERACEATRPDYAAILGIEPPTSRSGRTVPELAYKAMRESLEGISPSEMRKLAPLVRRWKELNPWGRDVLEKCGFFVKQEVEKEQRERRACQTARSGVVLDFKQWRAHVRYQKVRGAKA